MRYDFRIRARSKWAFSHSNAGAVDGDFSVEPVWKSVILNLLNSRLLDQFRPTDSHTTRKPMVGSEVPAGYFISSFVGEMQSDSGDK
jgi:hypothetical protein